MSKETVEYIVEFYENLPKHANIVQYNGYLLLND